MISVALPAFKTVFLKEAIESVLLQSHSNFELIIVNDASTDDVASIVKQFDDRRICYYENKSNLGIIENWNYCLSIAKGECFVLFSDDDLYHQDFLSELYTLSLKYPKVNLFHCRTCIIDKNGMTTDYSSSSPEHESAVDFIWHRLKRYRKQFAFDFMCRTDSLRNIGGFISFPFAWGSDDATWFSLANPNGVVATPRVLCSWRDSGLNLSRIGDFEGRIGAIDQYLRWLHGFVNHKLIIHGDEKRLFEMLSPLIDEADSIVKADLLVLASDNTVSGLGKQLRLFLRHFRSGRISLKSLIIAYAKTIRSIRQARRQMLQG